MASRKLYLIYILIILSVFLPPITSVAFDQTQTPDLIREVMQAVSESFSWLTPSLHVSTVAVMILLAVYGQRAGRIFDLHFAALFTFIAFANNIAVTESFGLAIITGNFVPFLLVALFWIWEAYKPGNVFEFGQVPAWRYWIVPFAILAFWFPISEQLSPNFDPVLFLTSDYGVFFCPTTPVVLAVLTLIYPRVNSQLLMVTALAGLLIGVFNASSVFIMPGYTVWMFILHIPLIVASVYALVIPRLVGPGNDAGPGQNAGKRSGL